MSAIALLIAVVVAFLVTGAWSARGFAGMFLFALGIIILPLFVHAQHRVSSKQG